MDGWMGGWLGLLTPSMDRCQPPTPLPTLTTPLPPHPISLPHNPTTATSPPHSTLPLPHCHLTPFPTLTTPPPLSPSQADKSGKAADKDKDGKGRKLPTTDKRRNKVHVLQDLTRLLRLVKDKALDPCIVFSFSRHECEQYAYAAQALSFNTDEEAEAVGEVRGYGWGWVCIDVRVCIDEEAEAVGEVRGMCVCVWRGCG